MSLTGFLSTAGHAVGVQDRMGDAEVTRQSNHRLLARMASADQRANQEQAERQKLANLRRNMPTLGSLDMTPADIPGAPAAPQAYGQAAGVPQDMGAYVPRPSPAAPDKTIEVTEASKRVQAMKRMQEVRPPIQFSRMEMRDGKLAHIPAADNRGKVAPGAPSAQAMDAMQSRLADLQSEEAARQRGQATLGASARVAPTGSNQYDKPTQYDAIINKAAQDAGIDPVMFKRLLGTESSFNPTAVSPRGAQYGLGIAQIAAQHGLTDAQRNDPNVAIPWAAQYLRKRVDAAGGDYREAIIGYKGGVSQQGRDAMGRVFDTQIAGSRPATPSTAPAGAPQAGLAAPQAPQQREVSVGQFFDPGTAEKVQFAERLAAMQLDQLRQEAAVISDPAVLGQMRQKAMELEADIREGRLYRMTFFAASDPGQLGALAREAGVALTRVGDGFQQVVNGRTVGPVYPQAQLAKLLFEQVSQRAQAASAASAAKVAEERARMQREVAVERVKNEGEMNLKELGYLHDASLALQKAGVDGRQAKLQFNPNDGQVYAILNGQPHRWQPGDTTGRVPIQAGFVPMQTLQ